MSNIFDYLHWRGDLTLDSSPFNEVDALIFSRLSYLPFDKIVPESFTDFIPIQKVAKDIQKYKKDKNYIHLVNDFDLIQKISETERFSNVLATGYVNQMDIDYEMQFSAIVFKLKDDLIFISYRGTDHTVVGWKENFNMMFMAPVPAQKAALKYLEEVGSNLSEDIIIGGHSKGGNLAVFSAVFADELIQNRIRDVYNNDGPGFNNQIINQSKINGIINKTHTFVPQSSVVGMLMERKEEYTVVKSEGVSLSQHNLYLWEVYRNKFIHLEETSGSSKFLNLTLKLWLESTTKKEREEFVESLFAFFINIESSNPEINSSFLDSLKIIMNSLDLIDSNTLDTLSSAISLLFRSAEKSFEYLSENELRKLERKLKKIVELIKK